MKLRISYCHALVFAWTVSTAAALLCADDWPLARGDRAGAGVAETKLADDLEVLWKYTVGKDAGFDATAVIAKGMVYVGDGAGTFHAIRLVDGKPVWKKRFADSGFTAGAAIEAGRLYIGDVNGDVRCLSTDDGHEIWKSKLEGQVYAGPTPSGDDILFTCEAGTLTSLNKKDGKQRWIFRIEAPLRCSPTMTGGRAVLAGCDSRLHVIDVTSGKEVDSVDIDGPTGSTPAMRDNRVYFGTEGGTFFAIEVPADGKKAKVLWKYRDPERNQPIRAAAAVDERQVVFGSQGKAIYVLDRLNGAEKWKLSTKTRVESSPVIAGDRIVAATSAGRIYLLDPGSREVKWDYDAGGGFTASPAVVEERIVIGNTDGTLYCFGKKQKARQ